MDKGNGWGNFFVPPGYKELRYSGRIDFAEPAAPTFIWALSSVTMKFRGTGVSANLRNHRQYWRNFMGFVIDGEQGKFELAEDDDEREYTIAENLTEGEHTLVLFKRQDACHYVDFLGFEIFGNNPIAVKQEDLPALKIEFFGDSITCGEVSEAENFAGNPDPENHDGEFSNAWWSYAAITARKLNADARLTAQGGIALLDKTGWFNAPDYIGMLSNWDKLRYNPQLGAVTEYEFDWVPDAVVVAIGQNDSNPDDIMAEGTDNAKALEWKAAYKKFIALLRGKYPNALIVLKTTIMFHNENWDKAIGEVCGEINDEKVVTFRYSDNGRGTPGHIRKSEAEQMAGELAAFLSDRL